MVHIAKRQKVIELETGEEEVLYNSDTLSKIISFLPSVDLLNLSLTCKRFGVSNYDDSLIKESTLIAIKEIATEEELATLPFYNGENALANYHYLQFIRGQLTFDQLIGSTEYVNSLDKSCVKNSSTFGWSTTLSNNILRAGKHYVSFQIGFGNSSHLLLGVMRPGEANPNASGSPLYPDFFQHFFRRLGHVEHNNNQNNINDCCMYYTMNGVSYSSNWSDPTDDIISDRNWEGLENMSSNGEVGLLLDLDEGTLSVYKNRRKLGVVKSGLAGQYCWVVSMFSGVQVTIKRGTIPPS